MKVHSSMKNHADNYTAFLSHWDPGSLWCFLPWLSLKIWQDVSAGIFKCTFQRHVTAPRKIWDRICSNVTSIVTLKDAHLPSCFSKLYFSLKVGEWKAKLDCGKLGLGLILQKSCIPMWKSTQNFVHQLSELSLDCPSMIGLCSRDGGGRDSDQDGFNEELPRGDINRYSGFSSQPGCLCPSRSSKYSITHRFLWKAPALLFYICSSIHARRHRVSRAPKIWVSNGIVLFENSYQGWCCPEGCFWFWEIYLLTTRFLLCPITGKGSKSVQSTTPVRAVGLFSDRAFRSEVLIRNIDANSRTGW